MDLDRLHMVEMGEKVKCSFSLEVAGLEGFLTILPIYLDVSPLFKSDT